LKDLVQRLHGLKVIAVNARLKLVHISKIWLYSGSTQFAQRSEYLLGIRGHSNLRARRHRREMERYDLREAFEYKVIVQSVTSDEV
jgi:hypothetical protein